MYSSFKLAAAAALVTIAMTFASCSKDNNNTPTYPGGGNGGDTTTYPTQPQKPDTTVKLAQNGTFGSILTDSTGKSLYFFATDANGSSNCTGGCLAVWPVFYVDPSVLTISAGLNKSDFGTITTSTGAKQTTYKGWPLYYYASDAAKGDTKGDNVGTVWFIAKPDYTVMWGNEQLVGADGNNYVLTTSIAAGTGNSKYITDAYGKTLYKYAPDTKNTNNYTSTDAAHNANWPIYSLTSVANVPTGLSKTDFGIITVTAVNQSQVTYKGWPTYYFGGDAARGDAKGISVPSINVWPALNAQTVAAQ
jgi:predicted lipoprotein with Yx(FWY)xxD motif